MEKLIKVTVNNIHDIAPEKRFMVDELTIIGQFEEKRDSPILKQMCNTLVDGKRTGGNLSLVDISQCQVAAEFGCNTAWGNYTRNEGEWGNLKDCISIKKVILSSKTSFSWVSGGSPFSGCKSLECIKIIGSEKLSKYSDRPYDIDGVLFTEDEGKHYLIKYPANKGTEYTIPDGITDLSDKAFEDCHLTRLIMPMVPPSCHDDPFYGINKAALTIVVPKGSFDSYWMHPVFGKFNLEEMDVDV